VALLIGLALLIGCAGEDLETRLADLRGRQDEGNAAATLEEYAELAEKHPDNPEINFRLGLAMLAVGRHTEALFPLYKAADSDTLSVPAGIVLASTLSQTNNFAEAVRATGRVLDIEPGNEAALLMRTAAAIELHDGEIALEASQKLIESAPDNTNYQMAHAGALAEASRMADAEAIYRELVAGAADGEAQFYARACTALVRFLRDKRKDKDAAFAEIEACSEARPEEPEVLLSLIEDADDLGKGDRAIELLQEAAERHPESHPVHEELTSRLVKADRVAEARAIADAKAEEVDDPASWRQAAVMRRRTGDLEAALEAVEKALELWPTPDEDTRYFRTELLIELGRLDEAEPLVEGFETQLYRDALNGRIAQGRGDAKRALELYGLASINWPQNYGLRVLAARAAFEIGDIERAKSDLLEATRQAPNDTDAALWLAHVAFSEGNFKECLGYTSRQLKQRGAVNADTHLIRAEAFAATNRMPRALATLDELASLRDGEFRNAAWVAQARLVARSKPKAALSQLEGHVAEAKLDLADPAQGEVLNQLFDLWLQAGNADEGQKRLESLVAQSPDSAQLHALLGRLAVVRGDSEEAEERFATALELAPEDPSALSGRALLERQNGELAQAIETMTKAAAAAPQNGDYPYVAAAMVLESGDREAARARFERVLRDHPGHVGSANDLAFVLAADGTDLDAAQRYAELAVRLRPSPETFDTLGYVKLRRGAAEEAVGLFERALARQPDYATARYHLALALIERGEPAAARQALEEALALPFPEQQEARKVLARIDSGEARP
jgi:tetratricopeptide (TPR) repeat protein